MLENLYTTKMSADKKILQHRFTKIRSKSGRISKMMAAAVSCTIAVTMLGATIVMAAVDSNGPEHWDKNEIYFLNSMHFTANTSGKTIPSWGTADVIGGDGKLSVTIKNYQMRHKVRGEVSLHTIAELSGMKGTTKLVSIDGGRINHAAAYDSTGALIRGGSPSSFHYPYVAYYRFIEAAETGGLLEYAKPFVENDMLDAESGKRKCVLVEFGIDKSNNIRGIRIHLCLTDQTNPYTIQGPDEFDIIDAEADSLSRISAVGDKTENFFNSGKLTYFTDFERDYKNVKNDAIRIRVKKAAPEEIIIGMDMNLRNAEFVNIIVLDKESNVVAMQDKPAASGAYTITKGCMTAHEKSTFHSGEKYRVCIGVLDSDKNLIYRWQEYVSIASLPN